MSEYVNKHNLFLEPQTKQYGNHMVMTNVHKENKTKYINIDTRFRDDFSENLTANYNITLPERITEVVSLKIANMEIPQTCYNVSANLRNNRFLVINGVNREEITVSDGNYTASTLNVAITNAFSNSTYGKNITITLSETGSTTISSTENVAIDFATDGTSCSEVSDKYMLKMSMGWMLGFRKQTLTLVANAAALTSLAFLDVAGPKYAYLAVEEFSKGGPSSFISPLATSLVNKNIIARVSMDRTTYPYGNIIYANKQNGLLISDERIYAGKVDLQKLNVQLLNEAGIPLNLNGLDFSFCLEVLHE